MVGIAQTRALKYQRKKFRCALLVTGDKKKYKQFTEPESDLEDDWIEEHEAALVILEREKIRKKFEKENKKVRLSLPSPPLSTSFIEELSTQLEETSELVQPDSELKQRLGAADELEKSLKAERKKGWKDSKLSEDKLVAAIKKMDERIQVSKTNMLDRDEGKEVSLGTSKINYIDPRLTCALFGSPCQAARSVLADLDPSSVQWAARHEVPLAKLFSKTLITKFAWGALSSLFVCWGDRALTAFPCPQP